MPKVSVRRILGIFCGTFPFPCHNVSVSGSGRQQIVEWPWHSCVAALDPCNRYPEFASFQMATLVTFIRREFALELSGMFGADMTLSHQVLGMLTGITPVGNTM